MSALAGVDCPYSLGGCRAGLCVIDILFILMVYNVMSFLVYICLILIKIQHFFLKTGLDQTQSTVIGKVLKNKKKLKRNDKSGVPSVCSIYRHLVHPLHARSTL